jgi:DNA-binding MarR family transcriptional regulator
VTKPLPSERGKLADQAATFLRMMQQLHQAMGRALAPLLEEEHGIDFRLYFLLKHIEAGAVHPGAISKAVHLPNSVITRHLDQLVERGLLERSLDSEDSRRIKLTLTKDGQRVAKDANRTVCNIVGARLERLPIARREAFLAAFSDLASDVEQK